MTRTQRSAASRVSCTRPSASCPSSARTATSTRGCWPTRTPRSARRPISSSSRIITSSGCSIRRACRWRRWACPRADGGPVERDPRKIWQLFAEHYSPVPRDAQRRVARPRVGRGLRHHAEADGGQRAGSVRRDRGSSGDARVPAARAVRALQHRGAGHHRCRVRPAGAAPPAARIGLATAASSRPSAPMRWSTS